MDDKDATGNRDSQAEVMPDEAFSDLFRRHYRPVYRFFEKRGFAPEKCRDLTQETFLRVLKYKGQLRKESSVVRWLLRIAANLWKNELRWWTAEKRDGQELSLDQEPDDGNPGLAELVRDSEPEPLEGLLDREQSDLLHQALDQLPPQMRRCLQLRIDLGMKYREIATVMQLNVNTVKSQISQGKGRLKAEMEKLGCR